LEAAADGFIVAKVKRPPSHRLGLSRRRFLQGCLTAGAGAILTSAPWARGQSFRRRPNIVLLVADDQRADSMGCAGNRIIQTPNMDALAAQGVRFTQSFATAAMCPTSRVSLLTGLYPANHKIEGFFTSIPPDRYRNTHSQILRRAGYRVGFVGKWGIGTDLPKQSYDYFQGFSGQGYYWEPPNPKHLTVRQADQAIEFLNTGPKNRPFFLQVSFKAPHVQDEGRDKPGIYVKYPYDPALKQMYATDVIPMPQTRDAAPLPDFFKPSLNCTREAPDFRPQTYQEAVKDLYRLVSGLDIALGRIRQALRDMGAEDNTVIIYTADHGSIYGEHGMGGKWLMFEESIRRPTIIMDPRNSSQFRGTTRDEMVLNIDIMPTILDLAGENIPPGVQGSSLIPLATGQTRPWRDQWFYQFHNEPGAPIVPSEGIRTARWKYIRYIKTIPMYEQLFDLKVDPREQRNLAAAPEHQTQLNYFRNRWQVWRGSLDGFNLTTRWSNPA
jgi:arylsulfatase A-like enzyme